MTDKDKINISKDVYLRNIFCCDCSFKKTCENDPCENYEHWKEGYEKGLAEGRKEKELFYKVGKITKAELNKCNTIEEKMEWLGKVLGQAIFKNDMNYAVWVNVQKNNIIEYLEKENAELRKDKEWLDNTNNEQTKVILKLQEQIEKMKCCQNCKNLMCNSVTEWCSKSDTDFFECDIEKDWELAE